MTLLFLIILAEDKMQVGESKDILNEFVSFARQIANGMVYTICLIS